MLLRRTIDAVPLTLGAILVGAVACPSAARAGGASSALDSAESRSQNGPHLALSAGAQRVMSESLAIEAFGGNASLQVGYRLGGAALGGMLSFGLFKDDSAVGFVAPYVEWYLDPEDGAHVGGALGLTWVDQGGRVLRGAGFSVWGGYDFWVTDDFALGPKLGFNMSALQSGGEGGGSLIGVGMPDHQAPESSDSSMLGQLFIAINATYR